MNKKEEEVAFALIELVRGGDITAAEAVKEFRTEFNCSITYVVNVGLWAALLAAEAWFKDGKP